MGGLGIRMDSICDFRASLSVLSQLGVGGGGRSNGAESSMVIGTWSDPVDGREVSQLWKKGAAARLAKEMSRTPGWMEESKENRVKILGTLRREKPRSVARSKYGAETEMSWEESSRSGSGRGSWRLKSPMVIVGKGCVGKRS